MKNTSKRIFGNRIIGIWYIDGENGLYLTPKKLEETQDEYEWKADDPDYPDNFYPYKNGVKLQYDAEV